MQQDIECTLILESMASLYVFVGAKITRFLLSFMRAFMKSDLQYRYNNFQITCILWVKMDIFMYALWTIEKNWHTHSVDIHDVKLYHQHNTT